MQSYEQAAAYIEALAGAEQPIWWRCIHDTDKGRPGHKYYGTLSALWNTLCDYNNNGYGVFANINAFAENARDHELKDVWYIRTQIVDLDNLLTAPQNYEMMAQFNPPPTFAVQSSPGKFHGYWNVQPYQGNERYNALQRKLRQLFNGDKAVIDPTRVLRTPGFLNHKYSTPGGKDYIPGAQPHLVTCWSMAGYGQRIPVEWLEQATASVNVIDGGAGGRHELGDPQLAAPSLDWLRFGLSLIDPNNLDRGEWISLTAAFKQSGWTVADEETLFNIWSEWCNRYTGNDPAENAKNWNSIRNSEVGWASFKRRAPALKAYMDFGFKETGPAPDPITQPQPIQPDTVPDMPHTQPRPERTEWPAILSEYECKEYFHNCMFIEREGKILTPKGRFMNSTQFNGAYGGKLFVIDVNGKTTNEPWAAATRSTLWTIPKVDHVRFLPDQPSFSILEDQLGRKGVNTYIPIRLRAKQGDVSLFLRHMELMLPVEADRQIIYRYLAHNVRFPGFKIPWAPMIQSAEGVGKSIIQEIIEALLGEMYTYSPKAEELSSSGSTFNAWMRGKLMIVVNEIKVDDRRELIETLKPMISDRRIEVQSKGVDQDMEDNPANWFFFSNYRNAIPVNQNGRRYSIFYSAVQSKSDLMARGMNDDYFNTLFTWLRSGGIEAIVHWFLNYPVERGQVPMRAPETSCQAEVIKVSRGSLEIAMHNAIEDGLPGFKGGYVSVLGVVARCKTIGVRQPSHLSIQAILEGMGYVELGRASRCYGQESHYERSTIYGCIPGLPLEGYGRAQGYEG